MKLHTSTTDGINLFSAYGDDFVTINQEKYFENVVLLPDAIVPAWTSTTLATLTEADMEKLLALKTEIILLGTGKRLRFPASNLLRPFATAGIGLDVMDLKAACRTYNILAAEGRKVAAALLFD